MKSGRGLTTAGPDQNRIMYQWDNLSDCEMVKACKMQQAIWHMTENGKLNVE